MSGSRLKSRDTSDEYFFCPYLTWECCAGLTKKEWDVRRRDFASTALPPIIMEVENGSPSPSNISFLSFRLIFHFHGWSRMGVHWKRCPAFWMLSSSRVRCFQLRQRQYVWSWKKCCRINWCNWKTRWSLPTLLLWRCGLRVKGGGKGVLVEREIFFIQ